MATIILPLASVQDRLFSDGAKQTSTRPVSQGSDVSQQKCVSRGSSGSADVLS